MPQSESPVDLTVERIGPLTDFSIGGWKYVEGNVQGAEKPEFDDSAWKEYAPLNKEIFPENAWFRTTVTLPEAVLGQEVAGTRVRIILEVDDGGTLYTNGVKQGTFPWDGDYVLTESAKPGETFHLAINAYNTGGPLRLIHARLFYEAVGAVVTDLQNYALSLRIGKKLLSDDTYQTGAWRKFDPGIDKSMVPKGRKIELRAALDSAAGALDLDALEAGRVGDFEKSLRESRRRLQPVAAFAKEYTLHLAGNAHIDAAWLWRKAETQLVARNTFVTFFKKIEARYPGITFTQSAAQYYQWMQDDYPDVFDELKQGVKKGGFEIVGGMWIEPDCNLPSGESWARQLLYAKRYFAREFGKDVTIGWNPDSFGYNWNMPQFYRQAGIDAFITQKISWNDTTVFPYRLFWWEGADGSKILAYLPFNYDEQFNDAYRLADRMRQFEANTGLRKLMVLFGIGDHGGGPTLEMLARLDAMKKLDVFPTVEFGNAESYLDWIRTQDLSQLPVWNDELYLEYHQGTFTTHGDMKKNNRELERLLYSSEAFSTVAEAMGRPYRKDLFEEAWEEVMFNQFHDLLPGSGIREIYIDAAKDYAEAREIATHELESSLDGILRKKEGQGEADKTRTDTDGTRTITDKIRTVTVVNPLPWTRMDIVEAPLPEDAPDVGAGVPHQIVKTGPFTRSILFPAKDIPALGYRESDLKRGETAPERAMLRITATFVENEFFRITLDPGTGWIESIYDKRNQREVVEGGPANELQLLEDKPKAFDAWNIGFTGRKYELKFAGAEVVESGPVRAVLRVKHTFKNPDTSKGFPTEDFPTSFFTQDIILYGGVDRIDFQTTVDWWEDHVMLKVAFPVAVHSDFATYEIPGAAIRRPTTTDTDREKAMFEVPALQWADLSEKGYGVALLNRAKYGYDIHGNVMRLSLLRSPTEPDATADRGVNVIEYSLVPHAGDWRAAHIPRRAEEYNAPLLTVAGAPSEQAGVSFLSIEPANVLLSGMKMAEDGDAVILRLYEAEGTATTAKITLNFPRAFKTAEVSDFLEHPGAGVGIGGSGPQTFEVALKPFQTLTLRLEE